MEDDTVHYQIYPTSPEAATNASLETLRSEILTLVSPHVASYLWNCDRFHLSLGKGCLEGRVTYKDNVEDEWFVIGLVRHISASLGDSVACRVTDSDGEILLIEAADVIPSWAQEPDHADGRAWLFQGEVHLIPRASKPSQLTPLPGGQGAPESAAAARVVKSYAETTRASDAVQKCIKDRIGGYPADWVQAHGHVAHARLPKRVAALLQRHPQLLAQAVHHVTGRDARDAKLLRNMTRYPQEEEASVTVALKFTKHLYALIASEKLLPYKKSGWSLPPASNDTLRSRALGFRICAGLEILATRAEKCGDENAALGEEQLKRLNSLGYFGSLLPGSKDYNTLYETAKAYFKETSADEDTSGWDYLREMKTAMQENIDFVDSESVLEPESDETWLSLDQKAFDDMLGGHFKVGTSSTEESEIPNMFKSFLKGTSDMKGVENEGETDLDLDENDLDRPMNVTGDSLRKAFEKLLQASEVGQGQESSDGGDDSGDEEEYLAEMEAELKKSNVFQENNLGMDENLMENLMASMKGQVDATGPASTLLQSVMKK